MAYKSLSISSMVRTTNSKHHVILLIALVDVFPGPTIEARSEDILEIVVSNQLEDEEDFTIHWHGLHMRGKLSSLKRKLLLIAGDRSK
jgi:FtsP/CotA-like multicopper oxidase with cupredoxin domain